MNHAKLAESIINKTFKDHSKPNGVDLSESSVNNPHSLGILSMEALEVLLDSSQDIKATTIADFEESLQSPLILINWTEEMAREELTQKLLILFGKYLPLT